MFTGIVAAVGRIHQVDPIAGGSGLRLRVDAGTLDLSDVGIGDSIAIQGACMTVVGLDGNRFEVDVSRESLDLTVGLDAPAQVNLEKAMTLADRLGGHLVSGHVDGLGEVVRFEAVGESHLLEIRVPGGLARFFAYKGSVTVDGVSLTVNRVRDEPAGTVIAINLIPHTVQVTTLGRLVPGARVNLEVDQIARYVERIMQSRAS
ncbi:MAG: riboflavin synthase [Pseudomonadota bacterium]|nr:riboflavin synthase [Pseudomonadota bacterium]